MQIRNDKEPHYRDWLHDLPIHSYTSDAVLRNSYIALATTVLHLGQGQAVIWAFCASRHGSSRFTPYSTVELGAVEGGGV